MRPRVSLRNPALSCRSLALTCGFLVALSGSWACASRAPRALPETDVDQPPEPPAEPPPFAGARILAADDVLTGALDEVVEGDFVLESERAIFVIGGPRSTRPGSILGAVPEGAEADAATGIQIALSDSPEDLPISSGAHETIAIELPGGETEPAVVVARGRDRKEPSVGIETELRLEPSSNALSVTTTITNNGGKIVEEHSLEDTVYWGSGRLWKPQVGFDPYLENHEISWMASLGGDVGHLWAAHGGKMQVQSLPGRSRATVGPHDIEPGEQVGYRRMLIVAGEDPAPLLAGFLELSGAARGVMTGILQEVQTGTPIGHGRIEVRDVRGRPFFSGKTEGDGTFRLSLPPGEWTVVPTGPGRGTASAGRGRVEAAGRADAIVEATEKGAVDILVVEQRPDPDAADVIHRFPVPARVIFEGIDGTGSPSFGPPYDHSGAQNVAFLPEGRATLAVPPGRYRMHASRGPAYEIDSVEIDVMPNDELSLEMTLQRSVDTGSWLSADLRQYTRASTGSRVSEESRLVSNAARGIEIGVITDRDRVTDLASAFASANLGHWMTWFPGVEMSTRDGLFGCLPVGDRGGLSLDEQHLTKHGGGGEEEAAGEPEEQSEDTAAAGAEPVFEESPKTALAAFEECRRLKGHTLVQVSYPRAEDLGYFAVAGLDTSTWPEDETDVLEPTDGEVDYSFDLLEVLSGDHPGDMEQVFADWMALLGAGLVVGGTAGSGALGLIEQEAPYPRVMLALEAERPAEVTAEDLSAALRGGRMLVTSGPFPELTARVVGPGPEELGSNEAGGRDSEPHPDEYASEAAGIGEVLRVPEGSEVRFEVRVQAPQWIPTTRVSLLRDGEEAVVVELDPSSEDVLRYEASHEMTFDEGGWVVLRVDGRDTLTPIVLEGKENLATAAFTNPIRVEVEGPE